MGKDWSKVMKLSNRHRHSSQTGFTLLEVLVAVVVLSIGLLGLAGLQASGLAQNNTAYQRTQATLLAYDMLDRMRANYDGVRLGYYNSVAAGSATDPGCITQGCTVQQLATYDNYSWGIRLTQALPSGYGTVLGNGLNSTFTITVMWDQDRTGATGRGCSGNTQSDLTCLTISSQI